MGNTESIVVAKELPSFGMNDQNDTGLEELEQLREGFRRVTSISRNSQRQIGMDKDTFRLMVLCSFPRMSKTLGERLFDVLNTEHSGLLQWSELLSGLDLTQKMHANKDLFEENQCKLIFAIYDLNDSGQLQRDIINRFITVIYGAKSPPKVEEALNAIFDKSKAGASINYATFSAMFKKKEPAFLFTWIEKIARHVGRKPSEAIEELQHRYNVIRVREEIQANTKLALDEICSLEKWFQRALNGRLKLQTSALLAEAFEFSIPQSFCDLIQGHFGDRVDIMQFCSVISEFGRGTHETKRRYIFELAQEDGRISPESAKLLTSALGATIDEEFFTNMTRDEFQNLQLESLTSLIDQLTIATCSHFDCSLKPKEPHIEHAIIETKWKQYSDPHPSHVWYLLDTAWWYRWCAYTKFPRLNGSNGGNLPFPALPLDVVQQSGLNLPASADNETRPGPMKNWNLQYRHGSRRLKMDMVVGQHFQLIPEAVYVTLGQWYGGGPTFARTYLPTLELELYPLVLRVARSDNKGDITVSGEEVVVGQYTPAKTVLQDCCHSLIIRDKKTRLWCTNSVSKFIVSDDVCPYSQLSQDSILIVEIQETDGSWPLTQAEDDMFKNDDFKSYSYGLVGLENLGNTCFMSSAIQCLSHSRLLCDYFRNGHFRHDLNLTNKMGTQGKLAIAFGALLTSLWSTNKRSLSPVNFRNALAKFNQQFDNNDQHDAQELLAFLLSGLSEDLNRVKEMPPPIEQPDSAGRCDTVVADEWWQNYLKREVSIIVALFMGQYKSLLSCDVCHHQSASFEPFTFLQLPLRESETRRIVVTIVFHTGDAPMRCTIEVKREGTVKDMKSVITEYLEINSPMIIACINSRDHTVRTTYQNDYKISQIKEDEQIIVYQLENKSLDLEKPPFDTKLCVGDAVGVQNERSSIPSHARITACNENGTYDIAFWTGKHDFGYSRTRLIQYAGQQIFIHLVHRRMENATVYFTDPYVLRLFGTPLIVSIMPQHTSGYDLYTFVWNRLKRIFHWDTLPNPFQIKQLDLLPSTIESIALGYDLEHTKFGFCMRLVTMDGMACSRCPWLSGCRGCLISSHPDDIIQVCGRETIAIDWDIRTMAEDYDSIEASRVMIHPSFEENQTKVDAPLSIESCLRDFTANEHIDQAFCSRCKKLVPSSKKMDIWRLPPLLIIQLKRFHYTATCRKKLGQHVDFPLKGLNFNEYLVETSKKCGLQYWKFLGGKLAKDEIIPLYDLYGVINHIGILGRGHYVSTILSECDKKWKCFNDDLIREIDEKNIINSSAYILFYRRRDMISLPIQQIYPIYNENHLNDLLYENNNSSCIIH